MMPDDVDGRPLPERPHPSQMLEGRLGEPYSPQEQADIREIARVRRNHVPNPTGAEWAVRCSCGERKVGTPDEVQAWNREHDDSPNASHVVSWDLPGFKPWSDPVEYEKGCILCQGAVWLVNDESIHAQPGYDVTHTARPVLQ